jgi:hypothetical protein
MDNPSNPLGIPAVPDTSSSTPRLNDAISTTSENLNESLPESQPNFYSSEINFNELPLDELLDLEPHRMTPEQLSAYVQRCSVLRSSAQTRKAALNADSVKLGATKKTKAPKKDSVGQALALLAQLQAQKKD